MSHFFAYLSRMKLIQRWSLMQNIRPENVQEHSLQVAIVAHSLAVIRNTYFNGDLNPEKIALHAIYHDASEIFTGDMPTPAKYFSDEIRQAYKKLESAAENKLISLLPDELQPSYKTLICHEDQDPEVSQIVKAADMICAYLKCLEELAVGNGEFGRAKITLEENIKKLNLPEAQHFLKNFSPSFSLTIDELSL